MNPTGSGKYSPAYRSVIALSATLAVILYADRVCISQAAPAIAAALNLNKEHMGWIFGAFTLSYAFFEIPAGYLGDVIGPRRALVQITIWWSAFTAATGLAWNFASLLFLRFLFGAGEAGCFPNLAKAFGDWLQPSQRVRAQSILWLSARWGGAITPLLVYSALRAMNWRIVFALFGLIGFLWSLIAWKGWRSRSPQAMDIGPHAAQPPLNPGRARGKPHENFPWSRLLRSRSIRLLCFQYFVASCYLYFFITWFPTYLLETYHFDLKQNAVLSGIPLFVGGIGSMTGGWMISYLQARTGSVATACRVVGIVATCGVAAALGIGVLLHRPLLMVCLITLASFLNDLTLPSSWTVCMSIGGNHIGTTSGVMNMVGNLGGFIWPVAIGYLVTHTHSWNSTFYIMAVLFIGSIICWGLLDPATPFEAETRIRQNSIGT